LNVQNVLIEFILRQWLLIISVVSLLVTSVYTSNIPDYSSNELEVLFLLLALFVAVNGLQHHGLILKISRSIEQGSLISLKLILASYFLSMVITNDIALMVIVPLTLTLNTTRKDLLVIFEALAVNAGSALSPFGNPQNLFIYWYYDLQPLEFIAAIAPFAIFFLVILIIASWFIKTSYKSVTEYSNIKLNQSAYIYVFLLFIVLLVVLHILPIISALIVIIYALIFDRKTLRIDYALLFTFFFFFGLAENLKLLFESQIQGSEHVFLFSALSSQLMSNVPATLLFANFTENWKALLWGTNAGGFGSLFGSFANLIAYKLYIDHKTTNNPMAFTTKFLISGYMAFFMSIGLYYAVHY